MWNPGLSNELESAKIRWDLVPYTRGRGLDLGCGPIIPFPHFIGVDNNVDAELFQRPATAASLMVPTCEKLDQFADESMDFVYSSHLLEHIVDYRAALKEWWRLVKPGGHLVLYLPHKNFYPNIGTPGANPDHKHDFLPEDIVAAMRPLARWDLVRNEDRSGGDEYSFFQVYRKLGGEGEHVESYRKPIPLKKAYVVRYGAMGDVMQTASILPGLKRQGYHVTMFTVARGYEVLQHDPHVDEFVVQDENQVPQSWLGEYFDWLKTQCDRFVNLCSVVEGTLLPDHNSAHFFWPKELRHHLCNDNYVATMHAIAQVPYKRPETKFYATEEEVAWAKAERAKFKGPVVCWSLSGSSAHKVWPWVDETVARIMLCCPEANVVFLGNHDEQQLVREWINEPRVYIAAGRWSVRKALAFCQQADGVVGPETGVLNAMAMEKDVSKFLILSHSTIENLCRDWENTVAFVPEGVACYPCHQLHRHGFRFCTRHPEGNAACARAIGPDVVWRAIRVMLMRVLKHSIPLEPPPKRETQIAIASR